MGRLTRTTTTRRRSSLWTTTLLLLALLGFITNIGFAENTPAPTPAPGIQPIAGGPGHALFFGGEAVADLVGFVWKEENMPANKMESGTIEMWVRISDDTQTHSAALSYSAFSFLEDGRVFSSPDEMTVSFQSQTSRLCVGGACVECAATSPGVKDPEWDSRPESEYNAHVQDACVYMRCGVDGEQCEGGWTHLAITWDKDMETVRFYRNGTKIPRDFDMPTGFRQLYPNGCFLLGQDTDEFCGGFDEVESFFGTIDEVRVWGRARTPEEIGRSWNTGVLPDIEDDLNIYWQFDERDQENIPDLSGNGNHARAGRLPSLTGEMVYSTSRPSRQPSTPRSVISMAPLSGGSDIYLALVDNFAVLHWYGYHPDPENSIVERRIASLPMHYPEGYPFLTPHPGGDPAFMVFPSQMPFPIDSDYIYFSVYLNHNEATLDPNFQDTFMYYIEDEHGRRSFRSFFIEYWKVPDPQDHVIRVDEDTPTLLYLGVTDIKSDLMYAVLSPDVGDESGEWEDPWKRDTVGMFCDITNEELDVYRSTGQFPEWVYTDPESHELKPGQQVKNLLSAILFIPAKDVYNLEEPVLEIEYTLETRRYEEPPVEPIQSTERATIKIWVDPVNDAPVAQPFEFDIPLFNGTCAQSVPEQPACAFMTLDSTDVDEELNWVGSNRRYRITKFPELGMVINAMCLPDDSSCWPDYHGIADLNAAQPVTFQWVKAVVGGSSSYSPCTDDCRQRPWNPECVCEQGTMKTGHQAVGPNDVYPRYADATGNALFREAVDTAQNPYHDDAPGHPEEFWIWEFESPVYPSALEIYETFNPGAVVRIDVTSNFVAEDYLVPEEGGSPPWYDPDGEEYFGETEWTTIFQAREREVFRTDTSRIFSPTLCPVDDPITHVRVWFDVDGDGYNGVDAANLQGTVEMPLGQIPQWTKNRIYYFPFPGVHADEGLFDYFEYVATDCEDESEPVGVSIRHTGPAAFGAEVAMYSHSAVRLPYEGLALLDFNKIIDSFQQFMTEDEEVTLSVVSFDPGLIIYDTLETPDDPLPEEWIVIPDIQSVSAAEVIDYVSANLNYRPGTFYVRPDNSDGRYLLTYHGSSPRGVEVRNATAGFFVDTSRIQSRATIEIWVRAGSRTFRNRVQYEVSCPVGQWNRKQDGVCVMCRSVDEVPADAAEYLAYSRNCDGQDREWLEILSVFVLVIIILTLLLAAFQLYTKRGSFPFNMYSQTMTWLILLGLGSFMYAPLIELLGDDFDCAGFYWIHIVSLPLFVVPILVSLFHHSGLQDVAEVKFRLLIARTKDEEDRLKRRVQLIHDQINWQRLLPLWAAGVAACIMFGLVLLNLAEDNESYVLGEHSCVSSGRINGYTISIFAIFLACVVWNRHTMSSHGKNSGLGVHQQLTALLVYGLVFFIAAVAIIASVSVENQPLGKLVYTLIPIFYVWHAVIWAGVRTFVVSGSSSESDEDNIAQARAMMEDRRGRSYLAYFSLSEFTTENVTAYEAIRRFQKPGKKPLQMNAELQNIWTKYVSRSAPLAINISAQHYRKIEIQFEHCSSNAAEYPSTASELQAMQMCVEGAKDDLLQRLGDMYSRFRATPLYTKWLAGEPLDQDKLRQVRLISKNQNPDRTSNTSRTGVSLNSSGGGSVTYPSSGGLASTDASSYVSPFAGASKTASAPSASSAVSSSAAAAAEQKEIEMASMSSSNKASSSAAAATPAAGNTTADGKRVLPRGWEEHKDDQGRSYYWNPWTDDSQYEFPSHSAQPAV